MQADVFQSLPHVVAVAEHGGFSAAARHLQMTPAGVSKAISVLEDQLGVALFHRTTRSVRITPEGERYLAHAQAAQRSMRQAHYELSLHNTAGRVTLGLPYVLSRSVRALVPTLQAAFPDITLVLQHSDRFVSLVRDDVDLALRIGHLDDSALKRVEVQQTCWTTVAAPVWVHRMGQPAHPEDLQRWPKVGFWGPDGRVVDWQFADDDGAAVRLSPTEGPCPLLTDVGTQLLDAAVDGLGAAQVFSFMAEDALAAGTVVELCPQFKTSAPPISLLRPPHRMRGSVQVVYDALRAHFSAQRR